MLRLASQSFSVLTLVSAFIAPTLAADPYLSSIKNIFAFGDSYTAIGYNPSTNLRNVDLHNTTSGGEVWIQYLAKNYTSAASSFFDFASVGATIDNNLVFSNPATDFGSQVGSFEKYFANSTGTQAIKWSANDTIFAIWFGSDDLYNCFTSNKSFSDLIPQLLTSYDRAFARLYDLGARNFLILPLPELSATPLALSSQTATSTIASSVSAWNSQLDKYVSHLLTKYQEANATWYDTQALTQRVLSNPQSFTFTNLNSCCKAYSSLVNQPDANDSSCDGSLEQYLWKNNWNPTFPFHQLLATSIAMVCSFLLSRQNSVLMLLFTWTRTGAARRGTAKTY
ncbi:hypothetical protein JCM3765_001109 [Sporobolomyces pararoseus]